LFLIKFKALFYFEFEKKYFKMKNQKGFTQKISNQSLSAFSVQFLLLDPNRSFKKIQTAP